MDTKLGSLHSWFGNFGLVLRHYAPDLHFPATLRTLSRQRNFDDLINLCGNGSPTGATITLPLLPSRSIGIGLGLAPGEGSGLPLRTPLRRFQQLL